jgi:TRAP-type C4-dicarboxylate transport system permease small subunit
MDTERPKIRHTEGSQSLVATISAFYGRLLLALALVGAGLLFLMMLMITTDVLLRNVAVIPGMHGLRWSNDISEFMLFLMTMLVAPWLLRRGQHIRVDILLVALPKRVGWYFEWICDILALISCIFMVALGARATFESYAFGSLSVRTIVMPEWWLLAPLPITFAFLAVEVLFRMRRLLLGERAPRQDAVSAG